MRYTEIEQGLLSGINQNDPYKVSKQLQIKQWAHLYGEELLGCSLSRKVDFVKQVISHEDCWEEVSSLEQVKLNRYEVGRKLLAATMPNGEENPFNNMQKYKVACLCCFEDQIRELFAAKRANVDSEVSTEILLESTYAGHGPLVTYWSYYVSGHMDKFKQEFKRIGDNNDLHGFESAVRGKHAEALEYFWNKLQPVLSSEEKDDLLIYTATYSDLFCGSANSDMVDFAMSHLDESKYHQLLKRDLEQNKHYSSLYNLISDDLFDRAEELFKRISTEYMSGEKYDNLMYAALASTVSVPNDQNFINAGYKMLSTIWHADGFEEHKQFFMNRLSYGASAGSEIAQLVKAGRTSDILSEIVGALSLKQAQNLQKSKSWAYDILKEANLFNDDVMKQLAETEQTSVNILESQEELVVLGAGASIDNQEIDH
jgi:hypothetical protein